MEHCVQFNPLEVRQRSGGGYSLSGEFRWNKLATRADRGRVRKETFIAGGGRNPAAWQLAEFEKLQAELSETVQGAIDTVLREKLEDQLQRVSADLLVGHSFNAPLASQSAGTLTLSADDVALRFRAELPERLTTWQRDAVEAVEQGLLSGVSPGFRVPPRGTVRDAERLVPEPGNPGVMIREIREARFGEVSLVQRPAYVGNAVEVERRAEGLVEPVTRRVWAWL